MPAYDDGVIVEEVTEVTDELIEAWGRLLPMVSRSAQPIGEAELKEMTNSDVTTIFMAKVDEVYVGSLTLIVFRIPDGVRSWIEDVVVDEAYRGRRIGERLNRAAIEKASAAGVRSIDLTSNPTREAANKLYQKLGFEIRNTNYYRLSPKESSG